MEISPLVKVIWSMANLEALTFFLGPNLSTMRGHFNYVDVALGSMLPSSISVFSASCLEHISWPSSTCDVATSVVCVVAATSATFFFSMNFCADSHAALTSTATFSFYLFFAN